MSAGEIGVRAGLATLGLACFALSYYGAALGPTAGIDFDPALPADWLLPCVPALVPVYAIGVFWPLTLAWLTPRALLVRVAAGFALVSALSAALFKLLPSDGRALRGQCAPVTDPALALLQQLDPPIHLFPSLHVGYALFTALCIGLALPRWRWPAMAIALLQGFAVCLVKQHFIADVIAGAAIAALAYRFAVASIGAARSGCESQP
ncbi:hypothetical protein N183_27085 [Sinorhizobium sp. Sb3]|uniref:phosphatase PAP2 family protein n=1 Tax=Sinorhizobium sp. Sb3 TaxID=1358417 RepID=UPI00071D5585|nr:phosphatase PAP2 family protein [Sinorhizobium sp. Sb3]KSV72236.1 hypothetical protein N183_27085 [Sinorhizobium sp. Sb3]